MYFQGLSTHLRLLTDTLADTLVFRFWKLRSSQVDSLLLLSGDETPFPRAEAVPPDQLCEQGRRI